MFQTNCSNASVWLLTCRYRVLRQQTLPTRRHRLGVYDEYSQIPAAHSGPTHPPPSPFTYPSSRRIADFFVVGSGIAGMSFARRILHSAGADGHEVRVTTLETIDACSGATWRHISPPLYHDFASLKRDHRQAVAQKMMKLRLAHLEELRSVAEQEGILAESGKALAEVALGREVEGKFREWMTENFLDALNM
ncbi:hypothetical protein DFJ58DRAFT_731196 [Suillus subalutaceus]|uniref:uncharacterized protein n=1 Tax=Suillus subalutaceus TaxID=48586 RepID=UPI001B879FF1|nr:uncharacterized protein DFJ58DRAFT_731196 [Suillus subalutaceus]KAG1844505.1 hypothetical protein DFJ58DRAFT_731196 [Suillus subalutaceus]